MRCVNRIAAATLARVDRGFPYDFWRTAADSCLSRCVRSVPLTASRKNSMIVSRIVPMFGAFSSVISSTEIGRINNPGYRENKPS